MFLLRPGIHIKALEHMHDFNQMLVWTCFEVFRQEWEFGSKGRMFLKLACWHVFLLIFVI